MELELYQILLRVIDKTSVDSLIIGLAKQGYSVSYNEEEKCISFLTNESEVHRISSKDVTDVTN